MFLVVADQILQREAIMSGYKIYAGIGTASAVGVKIAGSGEAVRQVADRPGIALPIRADSIAVTIVPLRPAHGKISYLISTLAQVPRLGNQFHLGKHGVLMDDVEKRSQTIDFVKLAGQSRSKIEAEAIDVHIQHPIPQAIHNELQDPGMPHIERISGAGIVAVVTGIVGHQPVVHAVVDAFEG